MRFQIETGFENGCKKEQSWLYISFLKSFEIILEVIGNQTVTLVGSSSINLEASVKIRFNQAIALEQFS